MLRIISGGNVVWLEFTVIRETAAGIVIGLTAGPTMSNWLMRRALRAFSTLRGPALVKRPADKRRRLTLDFLF
jgi:hypothetical protein